jgi:hypothetical protein
LRRYMIEEHSERQRKHAVQVSPHSSTHCCCGHLLAAHSPDGNYCALCSSNHTSCKEQHDILHKQGIVPQRISQKNDSTVSDNDVFHVVGITNHDHLKKIPNLITMLIEAGTKRGEEYIRDGLRAPSIVKTPIEIYSLSTTHQALFPKFVGTSPPVRSGMDKSFMALYFLSDTALKSAHDLDVSLPAILKEIRRDELPKEVGWPAPPGTHFWTLP